jgi:hypothetical protein
MRLRYFRTVGLALVVALAVLGSGIGLKAVSPTPFQIDVSTAIDRGINWLSSVGAFDNPSSAGDAAGLVMEALLEKRATGLATDPPQGYAGASGTDQGRLRNLATYIINETNSNGTFFGAYRDGQRMFALSEYGQTGGPDKSTLGTAISIKQAMDMLVDRTLAQQLEDGYWCYNFANCRDSSTTQFAAAGLASAKSFYSSGKAGDQPFNDAGRVALINTALGKTRQAYETYATTGSDNGSCFVLSNSERGHGYRSVAEAGFRPSLQQTASGIYIQLFGGSNVNTPNVQAYIEWIRNRYRYSDLDSMGNGWPDASWSYYMWSSFKGMELIRQSGVAPTGSNLGPDSYGTLAAGLDPACPQRQEHKDPNVVARPASFGVGGAGYYSGESKSQYFDYAHQILTVQCAQNVGNPGYFGCGAPGPWDAYSSQAYQLLVLQRSTGGACVDTDEDGVCDEVDNCPQVANQNQANTYGGFAGDACEARGTLKLNLSAAPASGTAGATQVNLTGSAFPAGSYGAGDIKVFIASSCFGFSPTPVTTDATKMATILGATRRITFVLPAKTKNGPNAVWITGPGFSSMNCSTLSVQGGVSPTGE